MDAKIKARMQFLCEKIKELNAELQELTGSSSIAICPNGHIKTPDNLTSQGQCKICLKIAQAKYNKSDKGKAALQKSTERFHVSKRYIASLMGLKENDISDELYKLRLATLNLQRELGENNAKKIENHNR